MLHAAWNGALPWTAFWTNVGNDFIWLVPFALILLAAARSRNSVSSPDPGALS